MRIAGLVHDLLPLVGGQEYAYRLTDFNTGIRRRTQKSTIQLRVGVLTVIPWLLIIAWVGTAFYRATLRKDELLAEREASAPAPSEQQQPSEQLPEQPVTVQTAS